MAHMDQPVNQDSLLVQWREEISWYSCDLHSAIQLGYSRGLTAFESLIWWIHASYYYYSFLKWSSSLGVELRGKCFVFVRDNSRNAILVQFDDNEQLCFSVMVPGNKTKALCDGHVTLPWCKGVCTFQALPVWMYSDTVSFLSSSGHSYGGLWAMQSGL